MKRGDLITVALQGDQGKPRPALIIQADQFSNLGALTILPVTSHLIDAPLLRVAVAATKSSSLTKPSQIMIDKIQTSARRTIGGVIDRLDEEAMLPVDRLLALFLGLA